MNGADGVATARGAANAGDTRPGVAANCGFAESGCAPSAPRSGPDFGLPAAGTGAVLVAARLCPVEVTGELAGTLGVGLDGVVVTTDEDAGGAGVELPRQPNLIPE